MVANWDNYYQWLNWEGTPLVWAVKECKTFGFAFFYCPDPLGLVNFPVAFLS